MPRQRVFAIGLDGLEVTFADRLIAAGAMPALARLQHRAARFLLDHGPGQRTGLAWEHVASGLSPTAARRWAAVEFNPDTYEAWQEGARFVPWWSSLKRRVVVFDTPYVDLQRAPNTTGVVAWGAHDPGTIPSSRPHGLLAEFRRRFGDYPSEWTYGTPWPLSAATRAMSDALTNALRTRAQATRWLATNRLPDWDLFFVVAGEVHGSVEGLWHGVDPTHPLHTHPAAQAAARGLLDVHCALDEMIDDVMESARGASIVAFAMGGMGPNHSDVQSMVLLAELLYRHASGRSRLAVPPAWTRSPAEVPILGAHESWDRASPAWVPFPARPPNPTQQVLQPVRSFMRKHAALRAAARALRGALGARHPRAARSRLSLDWQPARRYADEWPRMPAFALPSFYDGRIRVNLRGRERHGIVDPAQYEETCQTLDVLLRECRNPLTGEPAVESIERASTRDPRALGTSESDLLVVWRGVATALEHPRLGLVGPVALRRTGGHTGLHGVAYVVTPGLGAGDRGVRSSFDVAPTLLELLGCPPVSSMSGRSLLRTPRS
jgi:predicted AlkP superfamily phosphohydrolase/phosphomutase